MSAVATELGFVFRLMVGGLFLVWGISKARNLNAFRVAIRQYELLPAVAVAPAAVTFAALECVLGALLVLGATVSVAAMASLVLVGLFTLAIGITLVRGRSIPCGCHASVRDTVSVVDMLRNLLILGMLAALIVVPSHPWAIRAGAGDTTLGSSVHALDNVVAFLLVSSVLGAWLAATDAYRGRAMYGHAPPTTEGGDAGA